MLAYMRALNVAFVVGNSGTAYDLNQAETGVNRRLAVQRPVLALDVKFGHGVVQCNKLHITRVTDLVFLLKCLATSSTRKKSVGRNFILNHDSEMVQLGIILHVRYKYGVEIPYGKSSTLALM